MVRLRHELCSLGCPCGTIHEGRSIRMDPGDQERRLISFQNQNHQVDEVLGGGNLRLFLYSMHVLPAWTACSVFISYTAKKNKLERFQTRPCESLLLSFFAHHRQGSLKHVPFLPLAQSARSCCLYLKMYFADLKKTRFVVLLFMWSVFPSPFNAFQRSKWNAARSDSRGFDETQPGSSTITLAKSAWTNKLSQSTRQI